MLQILSAHGRDTSTREACLFAGVCGNVQTTRNPRTYTSRRRKQHRKETTDDDKRVPGNDFGARFHRAARIAHYLGITIDRPLARINA